MTNFQNSFPNFPKADSVTIHQLLTHTSGIRDYHYFQNWEVLSQSELTPTDLINQVKNRSISIQAWVFFPLFEYWIYPVRINHRKSEC